MLLLSVYWFVIMKFYRHWWREGVESSRQEGADLLGFMVPKIHPYYRALIRRGFLPSGKTFQFMIYHHGNRAFLHDRTGWYVNWGDTDVI
jgi:hypothetical protein